MVLWWDCSSPATRAAHSMKCSTSSSAIPPPRRKAARADAALCRLCSASGQCRATRQQAASRRTLRAGLRRQLWRVRSIRASPGPPRRVRRLSVQTVHRGWSSQSREYLQSSRRQKSTVHRFAIGEQDHSGVSAFHVRNRRPHPDPAIVLCQRSHRLPSLKSAWLVPDMTQAAAMGTGPCRGLPYRMFGGAIRIAAGAPPAPSAARR